MKQLVKPAAFIVAAIIASFAQPSFAAGNHLLPHHTAVKASALNEEPFSIELNQAKEEVIHVTIKNPGKKYLTVTLNDPEGYAIDNFFAGKKNNQVEKMYNFSGAETGVYTIVVTDGTEKIKKQIKLERIIVQPVKLTFE